MLGTIVRSSKINLELFWNSVGVAALDFVIFLFTRPRTMPLVVCAVCALATGLGMFGALAVWDREGRPEFGPRGTLKDSPGLMVKATLSLAVGFLPFAVWSTLYS